MTAFAESLEQKYVVNRDEILLEDGTIYTPLAVLRDMARDYGLPIHFEVHEVHVAQGIVEFLVEMYVGRVKGRGEGPRRKMAMQFAAADLLKNVKNQGFEVAKYGMIPGCRISLSIFDDLLAVCHVLELPMPFYIQIPNDPEDENPRYLYQYKCQVGQLFHIGKSDSRFIAKRWAAKKVYEDLTGELAKMDKVNFGVGCNLLESYNIKPRVSSKKMSILKYRDEARKAEASSNADRGSASTKAAGEIEEDEFGDAAESNPTLGVDDALGRVEQLNIGVQQIKARLHQLKLGEAENDD